MRVNMPESTTQQQRYQEKIKENCLENGRRYYEENNQKKWLATDAKDYLKKKKLIRKKIMQGIDTKICRKKKKKREGKKNQICIVTPEELQQSLKQIV